jgi:hypothetical protein
LRFIFSRPYGTGPFFQIQPRTSVLGQVQPCGTEFVNVGTHNTPTRSDLQHFPFLVAAHLFHAPDLIVGELLYFLERSLLLIL